MMGMNRRYSNPGELEVLVALVRSSKPEVVVEFGCNMGRTAKIILNEMPEIKRYIGVDVDPTAGYIPACPVQRGETPHNPGALAKGDPRFEVYLSPRGSFDLKPKDIPQCQCVFIDGDHGKRAVIHDTWLAMNATRMGGIIIWHDYHNLETVDVRQVLESFLDSGRELYHVEDTWLVYEKREVYPPIGLTRSQLTSEI